MYDEARRNQIMEIDKEISMLQKKKREYEGMLKETCDHDCVLEFENEYGATRICVVCLSADHRPPRI